MEIIYPGINVAFRKIFGDEKNKDLLISFLNSILGNKNQVKDVMVYDLYTPPSHKSSWKALPAMLFMNATGICGKDFHIEIQVDPDPPYPHLCHHPTIHIHNAISLSYTDGLYYEVYRMTNKEHGLTYYDKLELHLIDCSSFAGFNEKLESDKLMLRIHSTLDMWLAFLTRPYLIELDNLPKVVVSIMEKALDVWKNLEFTIDETEIYQKEYESVKNRYKDLRTKVKAAVVNMLQDGLPVKTISSITTFSIPEIEAIRKKLQPRTVIVSDDFPDELI